MPAGSGHICDRLWQNPPYGTFYENLVCSIFHKYYLSTNLSSSFRPIVSFALEIECYSCDAAQKSRQYSLKALLRMHMALPYTTRVPIFKYYDVISIREESRITRFSSVVDSYLLFVCYGARKVSLRSVKVRIQLDLDSPWARILINALSNRLRALAAVDRGRRLISPW